MTISSKIKLALLREMKKQSITQAELARRMKITPQAMARIVNVFHNTKIDTLQLTALALGKRLEFTLHDKENKTS